MANIPIYKLTPTEAVVDDTLIKATPFVTGYTYGGSITPSDTPLTEAVNAFYLASTNGTYTNFGGLVVSTIGFIYYKVGDGYSFQEIVAGGGSGGSDVESGDGMDFITNDPVTLGLPSTIDNTTENAVTETSHTHKLGNVNLDSVVKGKPVEYGALYNWYAATDVRNITSAGDFVVPSIEDWTSLFDTIDTYDEANQNWPIAGGLLKSTESEFWESPNVGATNDFNFNIRGSGSRFHNDFDNPTASLFGELRQAAYFWTTDLPSGEFTIVLDFLLSEAYITISGSSFISEGRSIRLVRPASESELLLADGTACDNYVGNDGKRYRTVKIGTQVWLADNLNETKYRNGDWITGFDGGVYTPISDVDWAAKTTEAMCYYDDNEEYGGGETPLETVIANTKHNSLKEIQGGTETERYHLTDAEHTAVQNLGTISTYDFWVGTAAEYAAIDPKDANTIYHIEEE